MHAMDTETQNNAELAVIDGAVASRRWIPPLPAMLRGRYEAEQLAIRRPYNRFVLLMMAVIFDLFLFSQRHTAPEIVQLSAILRFCVCTPALILFFVLDVRGGLQKYYGLAMVTAAVLPTAASAVLILRTDTGNVNAMADVYATPLILLGTGLVARLTPREVFSNVIISVLCFAVAVFGAPSIPPAQHGSLMLSEAATGIAAIIFNLQLEARDRRVFLLQTSAAISRAALADRNRGLLKETQTDGLTGVANRRFFDETLGAAWADAMAAGGSIGLIFMDLDHFKSFNDVHGHQGGDDCLRIVAARARAEVRAEDLFARYGGEEFAAILPGATLETAVSIAERIRAAVQALDVRHHGQGEGGRVSVSVGAAAVEPKAGDDPRLLVEMADANLYAAKRAGRDRVMWQAGPEAAPASAAPASAAPMRAAVLDFKPGGL
jgi:diguanylate cyclase (GGDEF)-like protein